MSVASGPSGPSDRPEDHEVMASVDAEGDCREYVIADVSEDGAWLSMDVDDAPSIRDWR